MIYDRIKEICRERGITIRKLEQDLEFGRGSVRKFDQHDPSVGKMHMIAGYLGVTVDDLLVDVYEPSNGPGGMAQQMYGDKDMREIYAIKRKMSPERFSLYKKLLSEMYKAEQSEKAKTEKGDAGEKVQ